MSSIHYPPPPPTAPMPATTATPTTTTTTTAPPGTITPAPKLPANMKDPSSPTAPASLEDAVRSKLEVVADSARALREIEEKVAAAAAAAEEGEVGEGEDTSGEKPNGEDANAKKLEKELENLMHKTMTVFDGLVQKGELFWEESVPEVVDVGGEFKVQFRLTPALLPKPFSPAPFDAAKSVPAATQPPQKTPPPRNPFLPPSPSEIVAVLPPSHTLIVNKFSVLRPQLLLLTNTFEPQDEDLRHQDVDMAWRVLGALQTPNEENEDTRSTRMLAAYNCGLAAGCSQAHRHVQFVPVPAADDRDAEFRLWPDLLLEPESEYAASRRCSTNVVLPFQYLLTRLPTSPDSSPDSLYETYRTSLTTVRTRFPEMRGYNLIFTREWMLVVPRRRGEVAGVSANAFGMLGMVWVKDAKERERWGKDNVGRKVRTVLRDMGVPEEEW